MSYADRSEIQRHIEGQGSGALFSPESELAVVTAVLLDAAACAPAMDILEPEAFADPVLSRVYAAQRDLFRRDLGQDPALIRDALAGDEGFEAWGGINRLRDLRELGDRIGFEGHVQAIRDRALRRAGVKLATNAADRLRDLKAGAAEVLLGQVEADLFALTAERGLTRSAWLAAGDMIRAAIAETRARDGSIEFPTGLTLVDEKLGGLHAGDLTLLGGRPGMGKSLGAQAVMKRTAESGRGVAFFSLEMGRTPMALRLAADLVFNRDAPVYRGETSNITLQRIIANALAEAEWARLQEAATLVDRWPLVYDVRAGLTMADIRSALRAQVRKWEKAGIEPGLAVLDHMGKIRPTKDRRGSMHAEMADVSQESADLAKEFGIPVLGLVQLNRGVEGREDKRPTLADLRLAGELEQDARQVIFLYRPEYYLREGPHDEKEEAKATRLAKLREAKNRLYWIVAKNNHGPANVEALTFAELACFAVRDWDRQSDWVVP